MNFPVGKITDEEIKVNEFDWKKKLAEFESAQFNGFIVVTIEGVNGLEEGVLFFQKGNAVASFYEFTKFGLPVKGKKSLEMFFNALNAEYGIGEIHKLSTQQMELILAFNEDIKFDKPKNKRELMGLFTDRFSSIYARETLSEVLESIESKSEVFKRIGLTNLGR
ncbi:MAG: DUF2226 domain-containing protein [Candidatus Diapherotrites archaeon]